jgi:CheY-like chemotaxis protein
MARILVVDDESPIRDILSRRLTQWGHQVITAHSAEAAIEELSKQAADIVFSDVIMPVYDGVWLAKQVRARWPDTVIVAVSGAQEMETVLKMRQHGAVDYVVKPIGREMLHQALERALARVTTSGPV